MDSWNKLDFAIVVFSIVDMSGSAGQTIGFIKVNQIYKRSSDY